MYLVAALKALSMLSKINKIRYFDFNVAIAIFCLVQKLQNKGQQLLANVGVLGELLEH